MQAHGGFLGAGVITPGKQTQAQSDDGRIQGKSHFGQIRIGAIGLIKPRGTAHQNPGQGLKQAPVTMVIGVSQIRSRKTSTKTKMIEGAWLGTQASDDVAQALTVSQLAEAQGQKVIVLGKTTRRARRGKAFETAGKL